MHRADRLGAGHRFETRLIASGSVQGGVIKGDLILALNGSPVSSRADLRLSQLASGSPVKLSLWRPPVKDTPAQELEVEITAKPNSKLPPIEDAPPMFLVGASKLNEAPDWARKTLFGHASVATMLVNANGGILDGRQLYGKKHMILFWDWATREEQAQAAEMLQVLQLAQADLNNVGVDILFTHIQFPGNDRQRPMNDGQLRDFHKTHGKAELPGVPLYRFPNSTEYNKARDRARGLHHLHRVPARVTLDRPARRGRHHPLALRGHPDHAVGRQGQLADAVHDHRGDQVRPEISLASAELRRRDAASSGRGVVVGYGACVDSVVWPAYVQSGSRSGCTKVGRRSFSPRSTSSSKPSISRSGVDTCTSTV